MYDFYTAIFDKVQEKESWQQPSFLSAQLQEAVGQRHPEDSSRYNFLTILRVDTRNTNDNIHILKRQSAGCLSSWSPSTLPEKNILLTI